MRKFKGIYNGDELIEELKFGFLFAFIALVQKISIKKKLLDSFSSTLQSWVNSKNRNLIKFYQRNYHPFWTTIDSFPIQE